MASLPKIIAEMQRQIVELGRKQANMIRSGKVIEVDAANQRVKVDIGDEGNPLPSPWIRWSERAGARKTWNPPSVGELMTVMSPSGEVSANSLAVHGGFTDDNPAPSADGDALVFTLGDFIATVTGTGVLVAIGGFTANLTAAGLETLGGQISHDGKDIGSTHTHPGITPGGGNTQPPN